MFKKIESMIVSLALPLVVLAFLVLLLVSFLPTQASPEGSFVVNNSGDTTDGNCNAAHCTLREAISAANNSAGADIITFQLPANTTITLGGSQLPRITGDLIIDGSTAVNLTINGNDASRVFVIGDPPPPYPIPNEAGAGINGSPIVTISHVTIRNGSVPTNQGAAVFNNGDLTLVDCTIKDSTAVNGAVFNAASLAVEDCVFDNNNVTSRGGAIFNDYIAELSIINSEFSNNSTQTTWRGGGAIYNDLGKIYIYNSSFTSNEAETTTFSGGKGGGIYSRGGGPVIIDKTTFSDNIAGQDGGAIWASSTVMTITDSTFDNNFGRYGGGIKFTGQMAVDGSTFSYNNASERGGGIFLQGKLEAVNSTFFGNSAGYGGGIFVNTSGTFTVTNGSFSTNGATTSDGGGGIYFTGDFLNLINTIIADSGEGDCVIASGSLGLNINNLIEDGSCSPLYSGDPLFGPLANNGGPTKTLMPQAGSQAIENGDNSYCPAVDQRGWERPYDGDDDGTADCDIGAVEAGDWLIYMPALLKGP